MPTPTGWGEEGGIVDGRSMGESALLIHRYAVPLLLQEKAKGVGAKSEGRWEWGVAGRRGADPYKVPRREMLFFWRCNFSDAVIGSGSGRPI